VLDCAAPGGFARVFYRREILLITQLHCLTASARQNRSVPCRNMQNQFPNAVRVLYGMSRSHRSIDTLQNFDDRIAMPGFSIKGTAYLIS
jgi:hypothetical protein